MTQLLASRRSRDFDQLGQALRSLQAFTRQQLDTLAESRFNNQPITAEHLDRLGDVLSGISGAVCMLSEIQLGIAADTFDATEQLAVTRPA
jgi:hypothetical protein